MMTEHFRGCDGPCDVELPCMRCRNREADAEDLIIENALLELRYLRLRNRTTHPLPEKKGNG